MKRQVLIVASSDPQTSSNVAEAVRIAAGLSGHERLAVTFCFHGAAIEALRADWEDLADGDFFADYLLVLAGSGTILTTGPVENAPPSVSVNRISATELQQLTVNSDRVLRY